MQRLLHGSLPLAPVAPTHATAGTCGASVKALWSDILPKGFLLPVMVGVQLPKKVSESYMVCAI
jgi:hypothetical protein